MTLDMGNTDKLSEFRAEARAARHQGRAAVGQPLGRRLRGRRQRHPLCAGGAQGRRPPGGRGDRRGARRAAVRRSRRFRAPHQSARRQQARARKPRRGRRLRRARSQPRARLRRRRYHAGDRRSAPTSRRQWGSPNCSAAPRRARRCALPHGRAVAAGRAAAERIRRHRLLPLRPSARRLHAGAQAHARAVLGRSSRAR